MLLCSVATWGQSAIIGQVVIPSGAPLPGATIRVKEMPQVGAVTDVDGRFRLALQTTDTVTIEATMVGMIKVVRPVSGKETSELVLVMKEDRQLLETVVVTATRTPKLLSETPVVTRVIERREIEALDINSVQDLLQTELPGIEFSYSMNQQVSVNMQGFGGNSVLFLVDGERMAGETLDNIDYDRLNLDNVGRVEIVKGAASSLYGSNAIGGVVHIISQPVDDKWTLNVNGRYGSYNNIRYGGTMGFNLGKVTSLTNVQHSSCDPIVLNNAGDIGTVYGNNSLNIKERLTFEPVKGLRFTGRAGYFFRERESQATSYDRYRDFMGGLKADYTIDDNRNVMVGYSFDQYDKSDYALAEGTDVRDYSNVQHTVRTLFNHTFRNENSLTLGGDLMRDYLMSYQFVDGFHRQYTADAFAQWDWQLTKKVNVVSALRIDYYSESNLMHLSPKISAMYKLPHTTLRASYADGFRAPTLKEMYMNFDMANIFTIYGNADLNPEKSHNFNIAIEYPKSNFNLTATAFYNYVNDRITTIWSRAKNGMVYNNVSGITICGADVCAMARLDCGLGVKLSYVFTHESADENGMRSSSTRPHSATVRFDYKYTWKTGTTTVALNGRVLSDVTCDEYTDLTDLTKTESVTYPAYTLWRMTLNHRFDRGITLAATIDNLFNYVPDYYYSNSPATNGTTFALSVALDIDKFFK
ncbi:MAG: TonB-dependent receptor [Bacteroidales bacterium]|nr:TonB-dependent receptor [Bacteroidales bacterium]